MSEDDTRWLKPQEAADRIGISIWTLRHWMTDRKISFVRKGRVVRFRLQDIERFMNSGLVRAAGGEKAKEP